MSVQTEITRIQSAKRAISEAIGAKGVTVPPAAKLDDLAALAEKIPGPKPEQEKEITITENGDYPITADVGKVLSKVLAHVNVSTGGGGFDPAPFTSVEVKSWIPASDATKYTVDNPKYVVCLEIIRVKPGSNKSSGIAKAFIGLSGAVGYYTPGNASDNVWTGGAFNYSGADGTMYGDIGANENVTFDHTTGVFSIADGAKFTAGWEYAVIIARMPLK